MNYNYLKTFLILSENLSFSKTAVLLKTSQPAISRQIKILEDHYKKALFIRNKKTVTLSPFGIDLKNSISAPIRSLDLVIDNSHLKEIKIELKGASIPEYGRIYAFPKLLKYLKKNTNIDLNFQLSSADLIVSDINLGKIDFGFIHKPVSAKSIVVEKISQERSVLISAYDFDIKNLGSLKTINLVGYRPNDQYSHFFINKNYNKKDQQKFQQIFTVNSHSLMCDLVSELKIFAILPESSIQEELKQKKIKILAESKGQDYIYFIYHESMKVNENKYNQIKKIIEILKN